MSQKSSQNDPKVSKILSKCSPKTPKWTPVALPGPSRDFFEPSKNGSYCLVAFGTLLGSLLGYFFDGQRIPDFGTCFERFLYGCLAPF